MDTTRLSEEMQDAITYAHSITFLPLHSSGDVFGHLLQLWGRIGQKDLTRLFWEKDTRTVSQHLFLQYAEESTLIVVGVVDNEIAGACWLSNLHGEGDGSRCDFGGWLSFSSRGVGSEHVLLRILGYIHETLKIESIFIRSPWKTAKSLCDRAGLETVAMIERYCVRGLPRTLYIMRSDAPWAVVDHHQEGT